jgi:putative transposase
MSTPSPPLPTPRRVPWFALRERLKHAALRRGKEVVVIDESYTTKGCSRCGLITEIGGSKTFRCAHCGLQAPRDAKSARDILAKHVLPAAAA